jgi:hypothetical protein
MVKRFNLAHTTRQGERGMKDAVHHPVHLSVHFSTSGSVPIRRTCALRRSQFGRGQTTVLGWNDPGFGRDSAPKRIPGVVPAHGTFASGLPERPGFRSKQIEKDGDSSEERKNYPLHSRSCHVFTRDPHMKCFLKDLPQPGQRKSPGKKLQIGRERPSIKRVAPAQVDVHSAAVAVKDLAALDRYAARTQRASLTAILAAGPGPS